MKTYLLRLQELLEQTKKMDFIAPLLLRLYLIPIFWMAGTQKLNHFSETVDWFGNAEWGLSLPFPTILTSLALGAEIIGAVLLAVGLAVRWACIPLMITMIVAAITTHLQNGWLAIATGTGIFATERTESATERLNIIRAILKEHGNYEWLTEYGPVVILNNGIEFAITYFIMLLALFFIGGGNYISADYWVKKANK